MSTSAARSAQSLHRNNFDLLRLFAAASVMVLHICDHFGHTVPVLRFVLDPFPGVPIFFVISGFLISISWERVDSWRQYARNRILRIYPALWVAFALSLVTVFISGFVIEAEPVNIWLWMVAQLTFAQFMTPSFFEGFGTGILNGSLWTIPVELQFYACLPLLLVWRPLIWIAGAVSAVLAMTWVDVSFALPGGVLVPLQATLAPNLYMFAIGVLLARHFELLRPLLTNRAHWWFLTYLVVATVVWVAGFGIGTNHPDPLSMLVLGFLVLSAAFTLPELSWRILRGNDLSYGIYIYHMVVANYLLEIGSANVALAIGATLVLAALSWKWIERPALSLKKVSLKRGLVVSTKSPS